MDKIFTYEEAERVFASPALKSQLAGYPEKYKGKVPFMVKMKKTVGSDLPVFMIDTTPVAEVDNEYPVYVNSHGAVAVIFPTGRTLGVKPGEFEVTLFHT